MSGDTTLTPIRWDGREVQIETCWVGCEPADSVPLLLFLHEGLGSVALWRDFPERLCQRLGASGLVYSRPGYGRSTPRPAEQRWQPDFMHRQAREVLPKLIEALGLTGRQQPLWLVGHSDGGSIALLHAAAFPDTLAGAIVLAPHLFVEDISVRSIAEAKIAYEQGDLRAKLARYHEDVDSAFYGWNDIWLDPAFRDWNIEAEVAKIHCPVLAVQGVDDQYGTMAQIDRIQAQVANAQLLKLDACGHSPHKDQPEKVIDACTGFVAAHRAR